MRVLVTGSRDWTDRDQIADELRRAVSPKGAVWGDQNTLVHGDAKGADTIAAEIAESWGWTVEPHPADWKVGRQAGLWRNEHMVNLGADVCLAFATPTCRGTRHCIALAKTAGIPTRVIEGGAP